MPIAAVPAYLQKNPEGRDDPEFYLTTPPGHRFLLYFASLGDNQETNTISWSMKDRVPKMKGQLGQQGWEDLPNDQYACMIAAGRQPRYDDERPRRLRPKADSGLLPWRPMMDALVARQQLSSTSSCADALLSIEAIATAPFTTGLGNEHPLENGFAFLNPYGLPYLPGSGVKGVLRQAARELASGDWGDSTGWSADKTFVLTAGRERILLSMIDVLFGLESANGNTQHVRGALSFWDVIPQIRGDSLMVDVMTPHQSHYYQPKREGKAGNSDTPHDSGQPNPISFLTVPPGSGFAFHVCCDLAHLKQLAPELAVDGRWKTLLATAFEHAFAWLGFGAKTAVGYGAMQEDPKAKERELARQQAEADAARRAKAEEARQAVLSQMSPIEREMREFLDTRPDKNQTELSALLGALKKGHWTGESRMAVAEHVKAMMQAVKKWKEKSEKKNPDKDNDYQDTLKVRAWLKGE